MKRQTDGNPILPWALLAIPVLWLSALLATGYEDGMTLFDLMGRFNLLMERPFALHWTPHTLKFLLVGLALYGCAAALYFSTKENRRPGEEHGSARWGSVRQDSDDFQSPLDLLFEALEEEDPDHIAVREYKIFKQAAGKTAKSILISAAVRLSAFILPQIVGITSRDDMELGQMGDRKQAVFAIIPDNDGTFNYLVGMLYTCAFQALYYQADKVHQGALPVPVRLMMDEFCNVSLPDDFGKLQATMRSRNIMSTIVLQNISALKALFKDDWEGLMGNADTLVYLGGNEQSTHKYISEMLGKETIGTRNQSISKGSHGSTSTSHQQTGRELLTPDEVRAMDNDYAIVFIRGERPVIDRKYDILKHPYIKLTEDGGAAPYIHYPGLTFEQEDLSLPFDGLDNIEIIDEEDFHHEKDR